MLRSLSARWLIPVAALVPTLMVEPARNFAARRLPLNGGLPVVFPTPQCGHGRVNPADRRPSPRSDRCR